MSSTTKTPETPPVVFADPMAANGLAPLSRPGEPTWEMALFYPLQGQWTEADYLALDTNRPIELSDGCLEFLPMPTPFHQWIAQFLFKALDAFVLAQHAGHVFLNRPAQIGS